MLAKHLGLAVSRTSLREALRLLQHEGLVLSEPNRRIRIADVEQLYAMRIAPEAVAIRATVSRLAPEDFAELEGLMAKMDHYMRAKDLERWEVPHQRSTPASWLVPDRGSADFSPSCLTTANATAALTPYDPSGWPRRRAEHHATLDAAVAGDAELTVEQLVLHYVHTADAAIVSLDVEHEPVLLRIAIATVAPSVLEQAARDGTGIIGARRRPQAGGRARRR
jgi:DNA-binding GntR family transcriptional regulator